mmetsp:Transcript_41500/g.63350  ORF Transcript_41500/g.63350 Transcript_41500/m.63350 type:complete len:146 (+) Transcript_41500:976-1413(+)
MLSSHIDQELEQQFQDSYGYFTNYNSSEVDEKEMALLKNLRKCYQVEFTKPYEITDYGYFESVKSVGTEKGVFSFKKMFLSKIVKQVAEMKRVLSEELFDSVTVDVIQRDVLSESKNTTKIQAAASTLDFDCMEQYLTLTTEVSH